MALELSGDTRAGFDRASLGALRWVAGGMSASATNWDGLEDIELIEEAARGEVKALSALYDRFSALLLTMANRMLGDRAMAEDLVHDVFMEVWRNASRYDRSRGTVRTWVLVRLRSRALDRLRSATSRREVATDDVAPREAAPEAEDPSLAPDRAAVVACLAELPNEQRQVLELSYFQGLSSSEIAKKMGTPLGTVKSRTAAALAKLRTAMEAPRGGTS